jgi:hypothetical protein
LNLQEHLDFLNFWIAELVELLHRGQMAVFADYQSKYATSQNVKDALAPFRESYPFLPADSTGGLIEIADDDYSNFLACHIQHTSGGRTIYAPVQLYNEDEIADRLNSQVDPVTATAPIGEMTGVGTIQLYPATTYTGKITYLRKPTKPVFGYTLISGRVVVYNENTSTELEWGEKQVGEILVKSLQSLGINLGDGAIQQWAEAKSAQNYLNQNHI